MKKITTQNLSFTFIFAILMVVGFASAGYSDSFVDENTLKALDNFTFGRTTYGIQAQDEVSYNANQPAFEGDSIVDANAVEALKDFRFGVSEDVETVNATAKSESDSIKGDSFVNESVISKLDGFVFLEGLRADVTVL